MKIGIITYAVDLSTLAKKAEELGFVGAGTQHDAGSHRPDEYRLPDAPRAKRDAATTLPFGEIRRSG